MIANFRRRIAAFAVVVFLVGLGLPFTGTGHLGFSTDDDACSVAIAGHLREEVQAAIPVRAPEHCAICHLQRATSGASPAAPIGPVSVADITDAGVVDTAGRPTSTAHHRLPARAPPASLLS